MSLDRDGEPTAEPTPRRLQEARRAGDVPISRDLNALAAVLGGSAALVATAGASFAALATWSRGVWSLTPTEPGALLASGVAVAALTAAPVLAGAVALALIAGVVQTRALFCARPLRPTLRSAWRPTAWEPLHALLFALAALLAAGLALRPIGRSVLLTFGATPGGLLGTLATHSVALLGSFLVVATAVAAIDLWVRRRSWLRRLRMTARELRREQREEEGDPWIAEERRRAHRDASRSS